MKVNKLLTGATLGVGLLISAAPVFAASHSSEVIAHPTAQYINCPSDKLIQKQQIIKMCKIFFWSFQ
ncbi:MULTISPECIES: hypothetical protein [Bacillus]|uniref:hypothetical protein n=1 Tax=Bacillus TaxID=1386 RepID=UPI00224360FF|nr:MULTISPECIES: hypothetical protein [Bacillus]MDN5385917.1 hypothetical protein [Bacillus sp. LB7]MEC1022020.1 hypothetical protein [Bacillus paralicheniformis]MEC1026071.1 hypothetical protein [Bacillus paralicheniformis]MEC1035251.1 hypothetical protein [Bacillus paralicheniformis]MEC1050456.1 hypothetical protein [Bacillus paralicheniformis]